MLNTGTKIEAGDDSVNNQAHTINNNYGLSYSDVRNIATDVFKANITHLAESAAAVARERASEMTEKFLYKLETEAPHAINEFGTPAMQNTFFEAQKEYAINGDEEVADMLVEMLVERAKSPDRNRLRLVLDESLKIAPKLTVQQMDILTITHFANRVKSINNSNLDGLIERLNSYYVVLDHIDSNQVNDDLNFLEYHRLGKINVGQYPDISQKTLETYPAYFTIGFTPKDCEVPEIPANELFIPCFQNPANLQFRFEEKEELVNFLRLKNLTEERINYIAPYFDAYKMSVNEVKDLLTQRIPNYQKLLSIFQDSNWKSFEISNVGIAIALSNFHRRYGQKNDLSTWIR